MFFLKLLRRFDKEYVQLRDERKASLQQYNQRDGEYKRLAKQKRDLEEQYKNETTELRAKLDALESKTQNYDFLQVEHEKLREDIDARVAEEIELAITELGFSRTQIEKLLSDRRDLIEFYTEKLYSLAKHFAQASKEMRKNRGLFLLLIDWRNIDHDNFSEFHDGQIEHLMQDHYQGIDEVPHVFSPKISEVFNYMGEKVFLKNESGEITGYEERDGALLIDLRGITLRSRIMVEGVRTHRVYSEVEALKKGSAKHNAAIYASSLDEVMVAIVVSEETSEVCIFRDGRFIKSYNPYTDTEKLREAEIAVETHEEKLPLPVENVEVESDDVSAPAPKDATVVEDVEDVEDVKVESNNTLVPALKDATVIENVAVESDDTLAPPTAVSSD